MSVQVIRDVIHIIGTYFDTAKAKVYKLDTEKCRVIEYLNPRYIKFEQTVYKN